MAVLDLHLLGSPVLRQQGALVASVDADFFTVLGATPLSGRGFTLSDRASERQVGIVNASFVARVMRGRNPVGRRIRLAAIHDERPSGAWVEIVGMVPYAAIRQALDAGPPASQLSMLASSW